MIKQLKTYKVYNDYLEHQKVKTKDSILSRKRKTAFGGRVNKFKMRLGKLPEVGVELTDKKVLCLAARTGEEVVAFNELGADAIGIDLIAYPPHVIVADFLNLEYKEEFDIAYSNSIDHALLPDEFAQNVYKSLKIGGFAVMDIFPGADPMGYEELDFEDVKSVDELFESNGFEKISERADLKRLYRGRVKNVQVVYKKV